MKKTIVLLFAALLGNSHASAESTSVLYYVGEAISTIGSSVDRKPYIVARTSDPSAGTIAETVVSNHRDRFVENSCVMKIAGNQFTITEPSGTVTGGGEFTGLPWKWTFLRAEFKAPKFKLRIVDYNFFADPDSISGHKDFFVTDLSGAESLSMQEDVVLHRVEKSAFDAKRAELLGR